LKNIAPLEIILKKNLVIKDQKVLPDRNHTELYQVKTIALSQQVKRNLNRFLDDFMFLLEKTEADFLVSQNVMPSRRSFPRNYLLYLLNKELQCLLQY
jgi:hypothetical protein